MARGSRPVSRLKIKIFGLLGAEANGSIAIGGLVLVVLAFSWLR
jgi:hypothetical protein